MEKNYETYEAEDFVVDGFFNQWIVEQEAGAAAYWESWLHEHPEKQEAVHKARLLLLSMPLQGESPRPGRQNVVWQKIQSINHSVESRDFKLKPRITSWWLKVAASVLLLVSAGVFLMYWEDDNLSYTTAYGEIRTVLLPDSSVVTLNGNSHLSYTETWDEDESREVWLEGEAYFNVRKLHTVKDSTFSQRLPANTHARFVVHAGEALDVEVLGTKFNVNQNGENVSVALHEGKVQLNIKEENRPEWVLMNPGELVEYSVALKNYERKVVNTKEYISWRTNVLIFNDITLGEIVNRLERRYGYKISFEDQQIKQERFTGNVPADKIHLLFQMMERAFNLKITTTEDSVTISYQ